MQKPLFSQGLLT